MATRHHHHHQGVAPQQQRGAVVRQLKATGNNRRALGDIGNVVNARGAAEGVSRPLTRSFAAQLLRNAQAENAVPNAKKPLKPHVQKAVIEPKAHQDVAAKPVDIPKANQDVAAKPVDILKPAAPAVIDVSSGRSKPLKKKKTVHTLTSVLTARSKDACGIKDRPMESVHDIDAPDADDQLAAVDYVEDIYKYYKLAEDLSRPRKDYMDSQVEINSKMRAILTDWLMEVHHKFELTPETLYLTINIVDRYLSVEVVSRRELQLVGISAMLIACKYEEIWAPEVNDFISISDRAYSRERILAMEKEILNKLEWNITVPTPYVFIVRYLKAAISDKEMEHMVFFFVDLALLHYLPTVTYKPSMLAAAAVYTARCTLRKTPLWTSTLKHHTGYSSEELHDCAAALVTLHANLAESKLKVVNNKYSSPGFNAVALRSPARSLLEGSAASST